MEVSSYGGTATESSGLVRILKDLSAPIDGRDVLLVEDIIDTGLTLNYLLRYLQGQEPALDQGLRPARQAGPAPGRDPARLRRIRDPGRFRRGVWSRLRRGVPEPPLRGRAPPRGLRVVEGHDDASHLGEPRSLDRRHRRDPGRRLVLPAVVADRRRTRRAAAGRAAIGFNSMTGGVFPMFLAAVATLLLITLPFASEKPDRDRPPAVVPAACWRSSCAATACRVAGPGPEEARAVPAAESASASGWRPSGSWSLARGVFELFEERGRGCTSAACSQRRTEASSSGSLVTPVAV